MPKYFGGASAHDPAKVIEMTQGRFVAVINGL